MAPAGTSIVAAADAPGNAAFSGNVAAAADDLRRRVNGETVTYVINRNINYTNICTYKCGFCAFSKGTNKEARGAAYKLDFDEIGQRAAEAWARGATEVCLQGGIHPTYTGQTYLDVVKAVKDACPDMHVHKIWLDVHGGDLHRYGNDCAS